MDEFTKTILAALIGGLMVMFGKFVEDRRKEKHKKAEKLQELALALYDHQLWLIQITDKVMEGERSLSTLLAKSPPPPYTKLEAITLVHFKDLRERVTQLSRASAAYVNFILRYGQHSDQSNQLLLTHNKLVNDLEDRIGYRANRKFQIRHITRYLGLSSTKDKGDD